MIEKVSIKNLSSKIYKELMIKSYFDKENDSNIKYLLEKNKDYFNISFSSQKYNQDELKIKLLNLINILTINHCESFLNKDE